LELLEHYLCFVSFGVDRYGWRLIWGRSWELTKQHNSLFGQFDADPFSQGFFLHVYVLLAARLCGMAQILEVDSIPKSWGVFFFSFSLHLLCVPNLKQVRGECFGEGFESLGGHSAKARVHTPVVGSYSGERESALPPS